MDESEKTVHVGAARGRGLEQRVCRQLVTDQARYSFWLVSHEQWMRKVAASKRRTDQLIKLRDAAIAQVHKTALVRYLREYRITGRDRDLTLAEFYGVVDPQQATVAAHHNYVLSASTGFCVDELLTLVGDHHGTLMIKDYQETYGQYFGMHCSRARASRNGKRYVLSEFIPELKTEASKVREHILSGEFLPAEVHSIHLKHAS